MPRRLVALSLALTALAAAAPASAAADAESLTEAVESLAARLDAPLSARERADVHRAKAVLVAEHFTATRSGVTYADVFLGLDCVSVAIQKARKAPARGVRLARAAKACLSDLTAGLADGGASAGVRADARRLTRSLAAISARIRARRAFGAKATALRKASNAFVKRHFNGRPAGGVSFAEVYTDLECVDVKAESGAVSGAASCAKRLARLLRTAAPAKPPVTFGSDLAGTPVALPGKYPEDSAFWMQGLTVPADGTIERFRLRVGSNPVAVTVRFSVVRPQSDGRVKVVTTTDPRLQVAANEPRTYTVATSSLSFACCKVLAGDIVAVTTSGADQAESPFTWFAATSGLTTFVHTNPTPGSRDQDPGVVWSFSPRQDLEPLLQVVMAPS